jgi:hypothetical protein
MFFLAFLYGMVIYCRRVRDIDESLSPIQACEDWDFAADVLLYSSSC